MIHELLTKEIQNDIRRSVDRTGRTPLYVLVVHKNKDSELIPWPDNPKELLSADARYYFNGMDIGKDRVEKHLLWMSGFIYGATTPKL